MDLCSCFTDDLFFRFVYPMMNGVLSASTYSVFILSVPFSKSVIGIQLDEWPDSLLTKSKLKCFLYWETYMQILCLWLLSCREVLIRSCVSSELTLLDFGPPSVHGPPISWSIIQRANTPLNFFSHINTFLL